MRYLFCVDLHLRLEGLRGFEEWQRPVSVGNRLATFKWDEIFWDDLSADLHSNAEKELLDIWSGQPQQVDEGFKLPPQMKAHM